MGENMEEACFYWFMEQIGGEGGVSVINNGGRFVLGHTTEYMASGYADGRGVVVREGFKKVR
jgi:hypothetical protein